MVLQGLERLEAWKKAKDFAVTVIREVIPLLPPDEKYILNPQIRRSAQSIPANIAEGYGRFYYQETVRFCYIARGSLDETLSHLIMAHELGYIPNDMHSRLIKDGEEVLRIIDGHISYLKKSKQGENEPGASSIHESPEGYDISEKPTINTDNDFSD